MELSDLEALTLNQVKTHDVRELTDSKAFQSGVSLKQYSQPAFHNTFTQLYLKDVAWAVSELKVLKIKFANSSSFGSAIT